MAPAILVRNNVLLPVPAVLYAMNNYMKFTMQLYFNPATVALAPPERIQSSHRLLVTVPSMASVFNSEYALKSQYDTSIYLQVNLDVWSLEVTSLVCAETSRMSGFFARFGQKAKSTYDREFKLHTVEAEVIKQQETKRGLSIKSEAQDKGIRLLRLRADLQNAIEN
ncbi:hypothetical protein L2E82_06240 [Cichorium intybus]|uniref:Uncharacterized protein n=1 Tax=Cichorium intybus TaxID=13427 RepID=A0ACB9HAL3_CICIN|nr:hypothetical protein L2E82_06240 [Cichorium intybus]